MISIRKKTLVNRGLGIISELRHIGGLEINFPWINKGFPLCLSGTQPIIDFKLTRYGESSGSSWSNGLNKSGMVLISKELSVLTGNPPTYQPPVL